MLDYPNRKEHIMSNLEIIRDVDQGTAEWHAIRAGIPTASMFATVMASGRGGAESKTRRKYLLKLAGEILTGEPEPDGYKNGHMDRGNAMEAEARAFYLMAHGLGEDDAEAVTFVRNRFACGAVGYSPDHLLGDNGLLEIKTNIPSVLIERILADQVPSEHVAQLQGGLWVAEREFVDLVCYWPKMPVFSQRVYRDERYILTLSKAVAEFNEELAELVAKLKAY